MNLSHYLNLADKLDTIIVILIESFNVLDSYELIAGLEARSFVDLTVTTLSNFLNNFVGL